MIKEQFGVFTPKPHLVQRLAEAAKAKEPKMAKGMYGNTDYVPDHSDHSWRLSDSLGLDSLGLDSLGLDQKNEAKKTKIGGVKTMSEAAKTPVKRVRKTSGLVSDYEAERRFEQLCKTKQLPENQAELLRKVDQLRGLRRQEAKMLMEIKTLELYIKAKSK